MRTGDLGKPSYSWWLRRGAVLACALALVSCGGGSDDSNGGLCDQCGESDGFCRGEAGIPPIIVTEGDDRLPCDADVPGGAQATRPCELNLTCLRKLDSAQRRCFPIAFDPQFRCDGSRPDLGALLCGNGTLDPGEECDDGNDVNDDGCTNDCNLPPSPTVTPTVATTQPGPTPTPQAGVAFCGDNRIDDDEECDLTDLDEEDCESLCEASDDEQDVTGTLACNANCTFNFNGCVNATDCSAF